MESVDSRHLSVLRLSSLFFSWVRGLAPSDDGPSQSPRVRGLATSDDGPSLNQSLDCHLLSSPWTRAIRRWSISASVLRLSPLSLLSSPWTRTIRPWSISASVLRLHCHPSIPTSPWTRASDDGQYILSPWTRAIRGWTISRLSKPVTKKTWPFAVCCCPAAIGTDFLFAEAFGTAALLATACAAFLRFSFAIAFRLWMSFLAVFSHSPFATLSANSFCSALFRRQAEMLLTSWVMSQGRTKK